MSLTLYPNGVSSFGIPVLGTGGAVATGNVFFVDSAVGNDSGDGTFDLPFATLDYAIGRCTASNGDRIFLKEGHAETVATAGAIALDVIGVKVIGIGSGALRPTFTFSGTAATLTQSAASTSIENVIVKPSIDSVVSPIVVSAANCTVGTPEFPVVFEDASDTVEMVRAILTTAAADNLVVNGEYRGRTGGDACVNAVRLVGCNNGDINLDFYGKASTAVVEFHTTACTDIRVGGTFYNSGTTDGSKDVIDTVTGSTWYADVVDTTAAARYTGGSGSALASDDVSTIAANLLVPTADVTTNTAARDVIGNKTDAGVQAVTTNKSLMGYLKGVLDILAGTAGVATYPAAAVPGNAVSLAEVLRDTWDAVRNGTGGSEPGTNKSVIDAIGMTGTARIADAAGQLSAAGGTYLIVTSNVTSSSIPNNTQTAGAITGAASGTLVLENILVNTDATGWATPTNIEFSVDNTNGLTGAAAPIAVEVIGSFGANKSPSMVKDATSHALPILLESGKKVYIHGDDAAGTGGGVGYVTMVFRRVSDGATIAAANLPA